MEVSLPTAKTYMYHCLWNYTNVFSIQHRDTGRLLIAFTGGTIGTIVSSGATEQGASRGTSSNVLSGSGEQKRSHSEGDRASHVSRRPSHASAVAPSARPLTSVREGGSADSSASAVDGEAQGAAGEAPARAVDGQGVTDLPAPRDRQRPRPVFRWMADSHLAVAPSSGANSTRRMLEDISGSQRSVAGMLVAVRSQQLLVYGWQAVLRRAVEPHAHDAEQRP